jgi:hypothetical protein
MSRKATRILPWVRRNGLLCATVLLASPAAMAAEEANLLTDPFSFSLGTFIVQTDPTVQLNGDTSTGDKVDFNKAIGGADVTRIRLDGAWRFGDTDKHRLKGFVFDASRSRSETIDRDIEWGGNTYPVNAKVDFNFSFTIVELAYEYEFLKRDNYEIGASVGLHYTQFSAALKAKAAQSGGTLEGDLKNEGSVDLPLPVFGLQGTWQLPHNFWANLSGQFFSLTINEYSGDIQDYRATLIWQPSRWVGLGIGYDYFKVNVDVDKTDFKGSLDWKYDGPMIFYNVTF